MPGATIESASAIAGAASQWGNMFSQGLNTLSDYTMNKKNRQFAREQSNLAWERSQEMWNMTNAYNSPSAQMQRMIDAGLNPNLIYGNMNNTPAVASAKYEPARNEARNTPLSGNALGEIGVFQNVIMQREQIKQMQLMNEKIKAETQLKLDDQKLKQALTLAKNLGIKLQYGVGENDLMPGGLWEYDKQIKQNLAATLKKKIDLMEEDLGIKKNLKQWGDKKWTEFNQTGLNIDKDSILWRAPVTLGKKFLSWYNIEDYLKSFEHFW